MDKITLRKILDKIEAVLKPWIGMADPKRYGWQTRVTFGFYDGDGRTPEDNAKLHALVDALPSLAAKGYHSNSSSGEGGTSYTIYGHGLFKPLKVIPDTAIEYGELEFTFGVRDPYCEYRESRDSDFLITPINVRICDNHIDLEYGEGTVWFYDQSNKAKLIAIVHRDIMHAFYYDLRQGDQFFAEYHINHGLSLAQQYEIAKAQYEVR